MHLGLEVLEVWNRKVTLEGPVEGPVEGPKVKVQ